jgi:hypothetical protein
MQKDLSKLSTEEIDSYIAAYGADDPSKISDKQLDNLINSYGPETKKPETTIKGVAKSMFEAAPMMGSAIGGGLGAVSAGVPTLGLGAPGGAVVGAGLGGGLGTAIRSLGRKYVYDEPESREQFYKAQAIGPIEGAAQEMGGQVIGKAISGLGSVIKSLGQKGAHVGPYQPLDELAAKESAGQISQSAQRLGIKPTQGMLSQSPVVQGLESSLEQSPSFAGSLVRSETKPVRSAIKQGIEGLTKDGSSLSAFEVGESAKSGMLAKINERSKPIAQIFEEVKSHTRNIPLSDKSLKTVANNIKKIDEVRLLPSSSWSSKANQYADALGNVKSVDEIKTIRTLVGKDFGAAEGPEKQVLGQIYDKLSRLENNSIVRGAIDTVKGFERKGEFSQVAAASEGEEIGRKLVKDSMEARKLWKGLIQDLNDFSDATGLRKEGISSVSGAIEGVQSEKVVGKFFNTGNLNALRSMQKQFPDQFESLRQSKLGEIFKNSQTGKGEINPTAFFRNIKSIGPEATELLFGPGSSQKIADIKTVVGSLPDKMGPSGTPQGLDFQSLLSPVLQSRDAARYLFLKKPDAFNAITNPGGALNSLGNSMQKSMKLNQGTSRIPSVLASPIERRMEQLKKDGK